MTEITTLLSYLPPSSFTLVVTILGLFYIYRKIGSDRESTKITRDKDSQELHDDVLKLKFKVTELDGRSTHHAAILEDLRAQMALLNTNIAKMSVHLDNFYVLMSKKKDE